MMWARWSVDICSKAARWAFSVSCRVRTPRWFLQIRMRSQKRVVIHWGWGVFHTWPLSCQQWHPQCLLEINNPEAGEAEHPSVSAWWELMGHNAEVRSRCGSVYVVTDGRVRSYCGVTYHLHLRANKPGQTGQWWSVLLFFPALHSEGNVHQQKYVMHQLFLATLCSPCCLNMWFIFFLFLNPSTLLVSYYLIDGWCKQKQKCETVMIVAIQS